MEKFYKMYYNSSFVTRKQKLQKGEYHLDITGYLQFFQVYIDFVGLLTSLSRKF